MNQQPQLHVDNLKIFGCKDNFQFQGVNNSGDDEQKKICSFLLQKEQFRELELEKC